MVTKKRIEKASRGSEEGGWIMKEGKIVVDRRVVVDGRD